MFKRKVCPLLNHHFATLLTKPNDIPQHIVDMLHAAFSCNARNNAGSTSPVRTAAIATWKSIERQLQELPFSWFEASNEGNVENQSPNTQHAGSRSANMRRAVLLLSPAPQTIEDLRHFSGNQGKFASHNTSPVRSAQHTPCLMLLCHADIDTIVDPASMSELLAGIGTTAAAQKLQKSGITLYWNTQGLLHLDTSMV